MSDNEVCGLQEIKRQLIALRVDRANLLEEDVFDIRAKKSEIKNLDARIKELKNQKRLIIKAP